MRKAVERAMRAVAALPGDDWHPEHHTAFQAAQGTIIDELGRLDRSRGRMRAQAHRDAGWWTEPAAKRTVTQRSRGICELQGPKCEGRAREVHHAWGRRGDDPHHPGKLLHLCGLGNMTGCHGWVHQTGEGREAAREKAAELQAEHQHGAMS